MTSEINAITLCEGKYLRLLKSGGWEYVRRANISGIVGIVAVTDEGKLLMVEQYRVPVSNRVIELPAGLSGDTPDSKGELLSEAAKRELLEETGYEASEMVFICEGPPSSGMSSEMITMFLAKGVKKVADGGGDHTEDIVVHAVPVSEVHTWLEDQRKQGKLVDLRIYTALYFLGKP
ncbi:MAG TPA: NUDIX hydrolase [Armatimonadota bacterium]|jgi:ADP-ribose pyrophosphatase